MTWILMAMIGVALGHLVRRATPWLLADKSRELPFGGPWAELTGALLFLLLEATIGHGGEELVWYLFATLLLAIGVADAHRKYVPMVVCWVGLAAGLIATTLLPEHTAYILNQAELARMLGFGGSAWQVGLFLATSGALMGFLQIWFVRRIFYSLAGIEAMGMGDAFIMMMVGAWIGPQGALFALLPACLIGILIGGARQLIFGTPHLAFGPALAGGSLVIALFGSSFIDGINHVNAWIYALPPMILMAFAIFLVALLIFLVLRLRRKGAEYEAIIEEEYRQTDEKMQS